MPQGDFLRDGDAVSISDKLRFNGVDYPPGEPFPWRTLGRGPDGAVRPLMEHELRGLWLADRIALYAKGAEPPKAPPIDPEEAALDAELKRGGIDKEAGAKAVAEAAKRPPARDIAVPEIPPETNPGALAEALAKANATGKAGKAASK